MQRLEEEDRTAARHQCRGPSGAAPAEAPARPPRPGFLTRPRADRQGRANTTTELPRLKSIWVLPPAATAMYCLPPMLYETAGALTPAPHWYSQSFLPVFASKARNRPLPSPLKTRPPAVASTPPI